MSTSSALRPTPAVAAALDAALLIAFVLIGRASHGEGLLGFLGTLWPFVVGALVGWLAVRAWRAPGAIVWTGIAVWTSTVVVGMLLRAVSAQSVQFSFVIVTVLVLGVFLLGWRALWLLVAAVRRAKSRPVGE